MTWGRLSHRAHTRHLRRKIVPMHVGPLRNDVTCSFSQNIPAWRRKQWLLMSQSGRSCTWPQASCNPPTRFSGWCWGAFHGVLSVLCVGFRRGFHTGFRGVSAGVPRGVPRGFRGVPGGSAGFPHEIPKFCGSPDMQQNYAKRNTFRTFWPHDPLPPGGFHPQPNPNIIILKKGSWQ